MTIRALALIVLLLSGCSTAIRGTVQLVDARQQPVANDNPKGAVVNMINTQAAVEQASASAPVNEKGEFESPKDSITKGLYKVEVSRIGYETQTQTVEVGAFGTKVDFKLRKIEEAKRRSIKGAATDEDKIINPGRGQYPSAHDVNRRGSRTENRKDRHARIPPRLPALLAAAAARRACGERVDIEVKARLDGQPAAPGEGPGRSRGARAHRRPGRASKSITRKAGTELEVTVSKEAPGYRIEPWKTTFMVKLPKDGQAGKYRFDADLKAMRYVVLRVNDKGAPLAGAKVTVGGKDAGVTDDKGEVLYLYRTSPAKGAELAVAKAGYGPYRGTRRLEPGELIEVALSRQAMVTVKALTDEYGRASGLPGLYVSIDGKPVGKTDAQGGLDLHLPRRAGQEGASSRSRRPATFRRPGRAPSPSRARSASSATSTRRRPSRSASAFTAWSAIRRAPTWAASPRRPSSRSRRISSSSRRSARSRRKAAGRDQAAQARDRAYCGQGLAGHAAARHGRHDRARQRRAGRRRLPRRGEVPHRSGQGHLLGDRARPQCARDRWRGTRHRATT